MGHLAALCGAFYQRQQWDSGNFGCSVSTKNSGFIGSETLAVRLRSAQEMAFACLLCAPELMGCMMGFASNIAASSINACDSEDTASANFNYEKCYEFLDNPS
jgi:hypothetical protein